MAKQYLYNLFIDQLRLIFDGEQQMLRLLPQIVQSASDKDLKETLIQHVDETQQQLDRLKGIFKSLNENPTGKSNEAVKWILQECTDLVNTVDISSIVKDVGLIIAWQKVKHYQISSYGSARTIGHHLNDVGFNNHFDFDEIADTLQVCLDEESQLDERLTEIAEGGFFSTGINEEAEKAEKANIQT